MKVIKLNSHINTRFNGFSKQEQDEISGKCTPDRYMGRGCTARVYDIGDGRVAKVYDNTERAGDILSDIRKEKSATDSAQCGSYARAYGGFVDSSGRAVGVWGRVEGREASSSDLTKPENARAYRQAIRDQRSDGIHHVDPQPKNFILGSDDDE